MIVQPGSLLKSGTGDAGWKISESVVFPQTPAVVVKDSPNVSAGAVTATTAQLTAPAGKTTANSQAGLLSDDVNALSIPPIDLAADTYTELEWAVTTQGLVAGDVVEFRVTRFGQPFDAYSVIPAWTIGSAGGLLESQLERGIRGLNRGMVRGMA
jgi:hypothetical protein